MSLLPSTGKGLAIVAAACAVVLTVLVFGLCRPTPTPIPPKEGHTLDSLRNTAPDFRGRVDTLIRRETTYVAISRTNRVGAIEAQHRADSLRTVAIVADSAARAQGDSVSAWRVAADSWHRTATELALSNVKLSGAYAAESTARAEADRRADEFKRRLTATTDLNRRLAADLRTRETPCRVAWVLRCPSRKVAYVAGVLTIPTIRVLGNVAQGKPTFSGVLK